MGAIEHLWPHAPQHCLTDQGTFIVTAGTYGKLHHFRRPDRLDVLERGLLKVCRDFSWDLQAWAVFSNHYHFVAQSPERADSLSEMLAGLHNRTAQWVNKLDRTPGRKVWHNFWETKLTLQTSYLARLNYVQTNAVKHGLVSVARDYRWCSASWFERTASDAFQKTIASFKTDRIKVLDDFSPVSASDA